MAHLKGGKTQNVVATAGGAQVVALAAYRRAKRAAEALAALLHGSSFLLRVCVELRDADVVVVAVVVAKKSPAILMAVPRSVNGVRVFVKEADNAVVKGKV